MSTFLWAIQVLFGVLFVFHGFMLIVQPTNMRRTLQQLPYSKGFLQFIGVCEILGGFGLVLPWWLGITPILTPLAAAGLLIIMLGAASYHFRAKETPSAIITSTLAVLLAMVAYGRW